MSVNISSPIPPAAHVLSPAGNPGPVAPSTPPQSPLRNNTARVLQFDDEATQKGGSRKMRKSKKSKKAKKAKKAKKTKSKKNVRRN